MEQSTVNLIISRIDASDASVHTRLARIESLLDTHIKEDSQAHKKVNRHDTYFKLMAPGLIGLLGYVFHKLGLK